MLRMNKRYKQYIIQLVPLFIWCLIIFMMSHQVADTSSEMSLTVGLFIGRLIVPDFDALSLSARVLYAEGIEFYVRKMAHMTEYAILSFLVSRAICNLKLWSGQCKCKCKCKWYISAFVCSVLYAMSDEIHQLFIAGRTGKVTDVLIDSIGIIIGIGMYCLIIKLRNRMRLSE